jgi:hypothetical protein
MSVHFDQIHMERLDVLAGVRGGKGQADRSQLPEAAVRWKDAPLLAGLIPRDAIRTEMIARRAISVTAGALQAADVNLITTFRNIVSVNLDRAEGPQVQITALLNMEFTGIVSGDPTARVIAKLDADGTDIASYTSDIRIDDTFSTWNVPALFLLHITAAAPSSATVNYRLQARVNAATGYTMTTKNSRIIAQQFKR